MTLIFESYYPRPIRFSDPHRDWRADRLQQILEVPDEALTSAEYRVMFAVGVPAASYEEGVYFLPYAFAHLLKDKNDALDYLPGVFRFVSFHADRLAEDRLTKPVRLAITKCFSHWTSTFAVVHYDKQACRKKGWGLDYANHVAYSEEVCDGLDYLARFHAFEDVAHQIVHALSRHDGAFVKAAWFLEIGREAWSTPAQRHGDAVLELLLDQTAMGSAIELVKQHQSEMAANLTYWNHVFEILRYA
ncbi:MAG: hypothetical protein AAF610_00915 [Pseudomonadota bacterium]